MPTQNRLLRLLLVNAAGGVAIGLLFVVGLVALDAAQLRTLLLRDPAGATAFGLLAAGFAISVGGLAAATAAMSEDSYRATTPKRQKRR